MKRIVLFAVTCAALFTGCTIQPVQPWDRDLLAEDAMQLVPHPVNDYTADHVYFSKEAASGGAGVGGGGCGCN